MRAGLVSFEPIAAAYKELAASLQGPRCNWAAAGPEAAGQRLCAVFGLLL